MTVVTCHSSLLSVCHTATKRRYKTVAPVVLFVVNLHVKEPCDQSTTHTTSHTNENMVGWRKIISLFMHCNEKLLKLATHVQHECLTTRDIPSEQVHTQNFSMFLGEGGEADPEATVIYI